MQTNTTGSLPFCSTDPSGTLVFQELDNLYQRIVNSTTATADWCACSKTTPNQPNIGPIGQDEHAGLSGGAIAGIAAGSVVLAGLVVVGIEYFNKGPPGA